MSPSRSRYGLAEIRRLVESYEAIIERKDTTESGVRHVLGVLDLQRAMRMLPLELRRTVLAHGISGLSERAAAAVLQVSVRAIKKRYEDALEQMQRTLNGR